MAGNRCPWEVATHRSNQENALLQRLATERAKWEVVFLRQPQRPPQTQRPLQLQLQ